VRGIDDKELEKTQYSKVCLKCKHYEEGRTCKAFEKIPDEIWEGRNSHRKPYKGDNGIQFEKK